MNSYINPWDCAKKTQLNISARAIHRILKVAKNGKWKIEEYYTDTYCTGLVACGWNADPKRNGERKNIKGDRYD